MVNKREQLKEDIARHLSRKIETAQQLLNGLKKAQDEVKSDCETAKFSFQTSIDELAKRLISRKTELTSQIDSLCKVQIDYLQESIQAAFIALGSLQSTLANLDSFDNSQLINLAIPDYPWNSDQVEVSLLDVNSDCTQLNDDISNWGTVKSKEFSKVVPGQSTSSNAATQSDAAVAQEIKPTFATGKRDYEIQEWLFRAKPKFVTDFDDDFEMVQGENNSESFDRESEESSSSCEIIDKVIEACFANENKRRNECSNNSVPENMVQIPVEETCVKSVSFPEERNLDLAQWLRPKRKQVASSDSEPASVKISVVPEELIQGLRTSYLPPAFAVETNTVPQISSPSSSTISSKRQYLDFPCLRLDPKCWLQKKRALIMDDQSKIYNIGADVCFNLSQKEIIPPSYALPYPFWLRKC